MAAYVSQGSSFAFSATRALVLIFAALALAPTTRAEQSADQRYLQYVGWLCVWAKENAPQTNPVHIRACDPGDTSLASEAEEEVRKWWYHWQDTDPTLSAELQEKWNKELGEIGKRIDREEAARRRAAAAKAHAARIAAIPKMTVDQLCAEFRARKTQEALEQIRQRGSFVFSDLESIAERTVHLGNSEKALVCIMGQPTAKSRSVGSWGVHIQYVYRGVANFYVENGVVKSWQD